MPIVSTNALMLSIMIDAKEGRDIATANIARVYMHAKLDDFTLLKVEGASVDIMCSMSAKYIPFVVVCHHERRAITCFVGQTVPLVLCNTTATNLNPANTYPAV